MGVTKPDENGGMDLQQVNPDGSTTITSEKGSITSILLAIYTEGGEGWEGQP